MASPAPTNFNWTDEVFKKFYAAVEMFKDHQFGNKKIARYMGDVAHVKIDAAQIRYEKFRYQKEKRK